MTPCADLITAFCDHLVLLGRSDRTVGHRRAVLTMADRDLPHGLEATAEELAAWLRRPGLGPNARASYYSALLAFYRHAAGRWLALNPLADVPRPRGKTGQPRPVPLEQLRRLLAEASEPYRTWALIAAGLGARCVEISRLDRADVGPELTHLHGKGDKHRVVPTHPAVWQAVSTLPPGPVARKQSGERATPGYISAMASAYFAHIGHDGVTMHRLRHSFASFVDTQDLRVVQELLGHSRPSTTAIYRAVAPAALASAVAGLPLTADAPAQPRRVPGRRPLRVAPGRVAARRVSARR
ncbi:MAG: tyrosine-type recombinase/integrase [Micromonosporaceae bacterium]|nr:tyrosine-type recombinase/integrase [Micromonosporaceae bacterium]